MLCRKHGGEMHVVPEPNRRQPYLGDVIGELPPMRMPYRRRYEPADWIVNIKHVVVAAAGVTFYSVLLIAILVAMFLAVKPALAQTQVPPSCVVLAAREGQPIETEDQIRRARLKLWFMRGKHDPLVRDCRAAIKRYLAETK